MKPIHKRLYTVLPRPAITSSPCSSTSRVRSNSVSSSRSLYAIPPSALPLSFYDSPAPPLPSSRPVNNLITTTRLTVEGKPEADAQPNTPYSNQYTPNTPQSHNHSAGPPPHSLALTSTHSESHIPGSHQKPFFPYQSFVPVFYNDATSAGAYGIPKRSRAGCVAGRDGHGKLGFAEGSLYPGEELEGLNRAVQVGEDAYFVRGNAMGVADGVGGWSRVRSHAKSSSTEPSPSALFARRLMHYCSEEVEAASLSEPASDGPELYMSDADSEEDTADLYTDLEDSLDELEEGLDVLMILEKAFDKTMRAHVAPQKVHSPDSWSNEKFDTEQKLSSRTVPSSGSSASTVSCPSTGGVLDLLSKPDTSAPISRCCSQGLPANSILKMADTPTKIRPPVTQGSSTALLAVLEHSPTPHAKSRCQSSLLQPQPRHIGEPHVGPQLGAILRIAHLGDCMGMLIRGEDVVWRTEEMWWNFNTPVQLGPASPTRPRDAHVFTLPVEADDILILASDGLSDNLWDEDVLDEVVRFRRPFIANGSWSHNPTPSAVRGVFARSTLAGMLSEALCSRAARASERRDRDVAGDNEVPFARRAREQGRSFHGGKPDDISVLVAVVSPTL
ncbi:hypothetical protein SCP_0802630 [Sparassis crispa]|uniref:Protein phosphatase n=1 Tax=Sparassis crispa TaxID=139825 RepID=A0A401GU33_9APHY|nr:hypothetical protein SCP_0802630 [Sparassis crispa]GBE85741.1 hypothetical protein SCP_0802630 [Sparassis crispa]